MKLHFLVTSGTPHLDHPQRVVYIKSGRICPSQKYDDIFPKIYSKKLLESPESFPAFLVDIDSRKIRLQVAARTFGSEVAIVHVIRPVTIDAPGLQFLPFQQGLDMTQAAMQIFMRAFNFEICLVMVKLPDQPVIRVVALLAIRTQCLFVYVIIEVTVDTLFFDIFKRRRQMAGFTAHYSMLPQQRIITQIMVVAHIFQPPG